MIHAAGLAAGYGTPVLRGIDLEVRAGDVIAVVGPNGAGKSTLLRALAGALPALEGTLTLDGRPLAAMRPRDRAAAIAYVPAEDAAAPSLTAREVVAQGRLAHRGWFGWVGDARDDAIIDAALERTEAAALADRPIGELSSGEAQRAWIAQAVAQAATYVLFDEPTSHLDVRAAGAVLSLLRALAKEGRAIVVVLHDLTLAAAYADRVAVIAGGTLLASGTRDEVMNGAILSRAYGADVRVMRDADGAMLVGAARRAMR